MRYILLPSFLLVAIATSGAAQRNSGAAVVSVAAKIGGKSYQASGSGSCRHTPSASIYDVPAALWMVEHPSSGPEALQVNLTVWRPKNGGPEQLSLALSTRSSSHRIAVGGRGEQIGRGKISLSSTGTGGSFQITGKDGSGTPLEVQIECPVFTGVEAEGG
ncbi:MAG TPA: hypothetical protein VJ808_10180 [Gemmatimonadales bacterium]|nr:hypothetical protein [Gemmatimonadales bacterium]